MYVSGGGEVDYNEDRDFPDSWEHVGFMRLFSALGGLHGRSRVSPVGEIEPPR